MDGHLWLGQFEARKAIAATQQLEREHGLTLTPGLGDVHEEDRHAPVPAAERRSQPRKSEIEQADRTGEAPVRLALQEIIDAALEEPSTVFAFMDRLERAGVGMRANVASTGRMNGFSFELDGIAFKASRIGKAYSWKHLEERGVDYVQERDGPRLRARKRRPRGTRPGASPMIQVSPGIIGPDVTYRLRPRLRL
ncbi:MAG: hypothetical protein ACU0CO_09260 [Shimia sp.]